MASAMSDHLRSLRPALALGPAAGGPCWADRIVYSVGTFDRPRLPAEHDAATAVMMSITPPGSPTTGGGAGGGGWGGLEYGSGSREGFVSGSVAPQQRPSSPPRPPQGRAVAAAAREAVESPSPLRFLREFGAVVVVGVYTDEAHAASHGGGGGGGGARGAGGSAGAAGGSRPAESLEARCARVRPHADRVVVVDSSDPARVREVLFGAAAGAVGVGAPTNNCCFVVSDWGVRGPGGTEAGRRARREVRALMEASMPVFRLPSPTWECAVTGSDGEEEEEEEEDGGSGGGGGGRGSRVTA